METRQYTLCMTPADHSRFSKQQMSSIVQELTFFTGVPL